MRHPPDETPDIDRLVRVDGRVAVVTGARRGIGAAVCARLAEAGAEVIAADVAPHPGTVVAGIHPVVADITEDEGPRRLVDAALGQWGRLDIWVNNAGIYPSRDVLAMSDAEWDAVIALNLRAAFRGAREAAAAMPSDRGGVIVNIVSNAGMAAGPASAHYVASKHGLVGLTKALAVDLGPRRIRVVGVAPGVTRTEGLVARRDELKDAGWGDLDAYAARTTPLGRMAEPDEIARVVLFAACELASYVSGTTIVVDGGQLSSFS
jgi:NAD(P)-dependent dehydrogenase (short-subunit alcohol dehydrogenase family)